MDNERLSRLLTGTIALIAVIGIALSLATRDFVFASVFAVAGVTGALGYWTVTRYPGIFDGDATADLTTVRTVAASFFKLVVFGFEFVVLGYLCIQFGLVTREALVSFPPTLLFALLGALPGVFLGAGVPYLHQRQLVFHRLTGSYVGQTAGSSLTLGTYLLFVLVTPSAAATYVSAYLSSRLLVLVGGLVWSRL